MKRILSVLGLALVLVLSLIPLASAEVGQEVAYFSNAWSMGAYDYTYWGLFDPVAATPGTIPPTYNLVPGAYYYINSTPFRADSNGRIPEGTTFTTSSEVFIINFHPDGGTNMYQVFNARTGLEYEPNRYRAFSVYIATGDESGIYNDGYNNGYADGYDAAYNIGERIGYDDGYRIGKQEGLAQGRSEGYQEGLATAESGEWTDLFTALFQAPVDILYGLFDFNILGLDMRDALGAMLTLAIVIIVVKVVI